MTDITTTLTAVGREIDKAFADHAKERERLSSLLANERQDRKRADQKTIRFHLRISVGDFGFSFFVKYFAMSP